MMNKIKELEDENKELKEEIKNKETIIDSLVGMCKNCTECKKKLNEIWDNIKMSK